MSAPEYQGKVFCLGGLAEVTEPTDELREILDKVRKECEQKAGKTFDTFEPVHFRTQLVNGMNYFAKVKVAENDYIHVRAHRAFSGEVSLWGIQQGQNLDSPLEHFD